MSFFGRLGPGREKQLVGGAGRFSPGGHGALRGHMPGRRGLHLPLGKTSGVDDRGDCDVCSCRWVGWATHFANAWTRRVRRVDEFGRPQREVCWQVSPPSRSPSLLLV
jgi:hypothetical protein